MVSLGSVKVRVRYRVRVTINIRLFEVYFIHRYSVDGATQVATLRTHIGVPTLRSRTTA